MSQAETHEFQSEVNQLLKLVIHSLYSHKEIFLRELISNASDACDRLRFLSLTEESLLEDDGELAITIDYDQDKSTVTVRDNGVGMTRDEVLENIGTIARSGTREFVHSLTGDQSKDSNLIGQFGVGFYSVFMVGDRVTLTSRKAGAGPGEGVRWESDGDGQFTLETVDGAPRGTEIVISLKDDCKEYADGHRLRSIINKYSDHISLPIRMPEMDGDKKKHDFETVNKGSALWARKKSEITQGEYNTFYKNLSYDSDPPLATIHNQVEGNLEYISLFFIPSRAPFDLYNRENRHGVKLYVRRVFIADDAEHLMPNYLRFVRGIVDSADLPLNVSREFLQHNKAIDKIRAASVKKIFGELKRIARDEPHNYQKFWNEFGQVMKEGIVEDHDNQQALAQLARFASTRSEGSEQTVSLDEYIARMKEKQSAIYYVTADSHGAAKDSPHLEIFRKHDIEVLLLSDPVDEWLVNSLSEYSEKPLKSVAKGELDPEEIGDKEADADSKPAEEIKLLLEKFKSVLAEQVKDVRASRRLTDSPACLVADEHELGGNLERILKAMGQDAPAYKPILELNPDHPIIKGLDPEADGFEDWARVLFDQAALSEGAHLREPAAYVKRVNALLSGKQPERSRIITPG
ncbi:MAG: molecular chaperone HtpG [Gammaproteobacteria bacterium]|nr:molecular chaperone HtpG [Gammaproteobacteria bacterium]